MEENKMKMDKAKRRTRKEVRVKKSEEVEKGMKRMEGKRKTRKRGRNVRKVRMWKGR